MSPQSEGIGPTAFGHIGMIVQDVEKTVESYRSILGLGPIEIRDVVMPEAMFRGRPEPVRARIGMVNLGPIQLAVIQMVDCESPHGEFLKARGEGVDHLAFQVDDTDEAVARLKKLGFKVVYSGRNGERNWAYVEGGSLGGLIIELMQRPRDSQ